MKPLALKFLNVATRGFALALLFCVPTYAQAQDPGQQQEEAAPQQQNNPAPKDAAGLLTQLNLSPEQVAQMREIQSQSAPEARALNRRLNQARRALDEAIYADTLDEALIGQRAREVAEAQNALVALRARTELRVRRVLTPAQLQTFRELRQQSRMRQRIQRQLNRGGDIQRPGRNGLENRNRLNQRQTVPPGETPNERPLTLRERRRGAIRRP